MVYIDRKDRGPRCWSGVFYNSLDKRGCCMAFPGKMQCLFPKTEKGHQQINEMIPSESSLVSP